MRRRYYRRPEGIVKREHPFFSKEGAILQPKEGLLPFFQRKEEGLTVGAPGDKYEREADAMADAVMNGSSSGGNIRRKEISAIRMAPEEEEALQTRIQRLEKEEEPGLQAQAAEEEELQAKGEEEEDIRMKEEEEEVHMKEEEEEVQTKEEEEEVQTKEEEDELQTKSEEEDELSPSVQRKSGVKAKAGPGITNRIRQGRGNGQALAPKTKQKMESAFGADFSNVSVHTGADAIQMNRELHAQAFTHGQDIYFNAGKYRPESGAGQHLLAHELTHVIQQSGGVHLQTEDGSSNQDVAAPEGLILPGYTQCDFLDNRIAHHAQRALYTLYQQGGAMRIEALSILSSVRSGELDSIMKEDYGKPAMLARRNGTVWWELIPKGQGASIITFEEPPMMVYKNSIASNRAALAGAIFSAWQESPLSERAHVIEPPSGAPCAINLPEVKIEGEIPEKKKKTNPPQGCFDTINWEVFFEGSHPGCESIHQAIELVCLANHPLFNFPILKNFDPTGCTRITSVPMGTRIEECVVSEGFGFLATECGIPTGPPGKAEIRKRYKSWIATK